MQVRLVTLCGCSQIMEINGDLPPAIRVPMKTGLVNMTSDKDPAANSLLVGVRVFQYERITNVPEYIEVLDERLKH